MKKKILIAVISLIAGCAVAGFFVHNYYNSNPTELNDSVYITKFGHKYHREDCRTIMWHPTKHAVEREKAIEMGREACSVCNP